MPNVKIFGFPRSDSTNYTLTQEKANLAVAIRNHLSQLPFADDTVITLVDSWCHNLRVVRSPYLEVASSDPAQIEAIVKVLKPLGYDIETIVIHGFHPAKK